MLSSRPEMTVAFIDAMKEIRVPATVRRYVASISHPNHAAALAGVVNE